MFQRLILTLVNGIALLMLLILHIITPKATKPTILFGVSVPKDAIYYEEVKDLYRKYEKHSLILGGFSLIILSILVYYIHRFEFQILSIFLYIGVLFLIYLNFNYKTKKLKRNKNWYIINTKAIVVDKEGYMKIQAKGEDDLWKIGNTIYFNLKDPALFVRKRYGIGWTINMGRPLGIIISIVLLCLMIIGVKTLTK